MSPEQNKAVVRRFVEVIQNQHKLEALVEFFSQDFFDYGGMTDPPNIEGARAFFATNFAAFPDQHFIIHMQLAEGDKVMTYKTLHGTHQGSFLGFPATGNKVSFDIIDIFTVVDGMITEHRLVADKLTMMQQLGALPTPE
ncbi:MAG: ester cyclase [Chloroflexota bacterium]|nr:ester cyclase [Chloroflexota bacterium]